MVLRKLLITAALVLVPATAALAHDEDGEPNWSHGKDHAEHYDYHDEIAQEHERAHEEGFYSRGEHRAYHRALRREHRDFHEDHPNTWHDHYRRYRYYGNSWYGNDGYYYAPRYRYRYYGNWGW
jgi:hypothetical protein